LQDQPYTVTETLHEVTGLPVGAAWPQDLDPWQLEVFLPITVADRTTRWERGSDPLWQYTFTESYDLYGQSKSKISVACPRGFAPDAAPGTPYLVTHAVTDYAQRDDSCLYLVERVARLTTYEIVNDGSMSVDDLHQLVRSGSATIQLIGQSVSFYDGSAFEGEAFGQLGSYGALVRTDNLVMTGNMLDAAYASGSTSSDAPEEPPYLVPGMTPPWSDEYPVEFRTLLVTGAGYVYRASSAGSPYAAGYFASTERREYDFQLNPSGNGRGLVAVRRNALERDTTTGYDKYQLLTALVTDPVGLQTSADPNYRVLQPGQVTDANGNQSVLTYSPLGLVSGRAVRGKTRAEGDQARASTQFAYDFDAFDVRSQPLNVRT
jgi:hypothetical protein